MTRPRAALALLVLPGLGLAAAWLLRGSAAETVAPSAATEVPGASGPRSGAPPARPGASRSVAGRVTRQGRPLAGALVRLASVSLSGALPDASAHSRDDGRFDLGRHAPGEYLVTAEAAGLAPAFALVRLDDPRAAPDPSRLELALGDCVHGVEGTVLDAGGGAVTEARVVFLVAHTPRGWSVPTDAGGRYRLCLPLAASGRLRAEADGYGAEVLDLVAPLPTSIRRDFRLSPEAVVSGRVVDPHGAPLGGAIVLLGLGGQAPRAVADADGRFRLAGLPGGRHSLGALGLIVQPPQEIVLRPGQLLEGVVIVARQAARLSGEVRRQGAPVAGARVIAQTQNGGDWMRVFSQDDGRFRVDGLELGSTVVLDVEGEQLASQPRLEIARAEVTGIVLALSAVRLVRGRVTLAGSGIEATMQAIGPAATRSVRSGLDGTFELSLPPGQYHLGAEAEGAEVGAVPLDVPPEAEIAPVELALASTGSLTGVLVDQRGAPIAGVWIGAADERAGSGRATTGLDGAFVITGLAPGAYGLSAEVPALDIPLPLLRIEPEPPVQLVPGALHRTGLRLVARHEGHVIAGRVEAAGGEPVADASVMMGRGPHGEPRASPDAPSATTGLDGRFELRGVPAGRFDLSVHSPDGERVVVRAVEAGRRDLVVRLGGRGAIAGRLIGFQSSPARLGATRICPAGLRDEDAAGDCGRELRGTVTGDRFHIESVPVGRYRVAALGEVEQAARELEVESGAATEVTLQSSGVGAVRVRTLDFVSGAALPAVACSLSRDRGRRDYVTDAAGSVDIAPVAAGGVSIQCGGSGRLSSGRADLELAPGGHADAEVLLVQRPGGPRARIGALFAGSPGLRASEVDPGGPAARGGLLVGDIVVAVDGRRIARLESNAAYGLLLERPAGSTVRLVVDRDGSERPLEIVLSRNP